MPVNLPVEVPDWAESSSALIGQPTGAQQSSGFVLGQRPSAQVVNWLFRSLGRAVRFLGDQINNVSTVRVVAGANLAARQPVPSYTVGFLST